METCPPGAVLEVLSAVLAEQLDARGVELLVIDYGLRGLRTVPAPGADGSGAELAVDGSVAGRAFIAGRVMTGAVNPDGVWVYVPVTVRGDRMGVLRLRVPAPPDPALRDELAQLGVVVGHALAAANRDTDVFEQAARRGRLSLAAEMQWQLLPGRYCAGAEFALAGQLEPAYGIRGDNFDWSCAANHLELSVTDGMGEGAKASMLTHLGVTALRNARRAGLGLADQACLADQAVFAHHRGSVHLATLLLRFDFTAGRAWAVDAGSPLLFRQRDNGWELVELDQQLPLGMFEGTEYVAQEFPISRGDRLLIVTDGVHDAAPGEHRRRFREAGLPEIAAATRDLAVDEAARRIIHEVVARHGGGGLVADAIVVCLDWLGPAAEHRGDGGPLADAAR